MKINNFNYNYTSNIKQQAAPATNKKVSFGGVYQKALDKCANPISNFMMKVSDTKIAKKIVKGFSSTKLGYTHMMTIESIVIGAFYMQNTARNKNIEKKQKLPLMINDGLVTALAAVLNYTLDDRISSSIDKLQESVKKHTMLNATKEMFEKTKDVVDNDTISKICAKINPNNLKQGKEGFKKAIGEVVENKETLSKLMDVITPEAIQTAADKTVDIKDMKRITEGMKAFKTMVIFALIYRYISPVVITPIANKISGSIQKSIKAKNEKTDIQAPQAAQATTTAQAPAPKMDIKKA